MQSQFARIGLNRGMLILRPAKFVVYKGEIRLCAGLDHDFEVLIQRYTTT